MSSGFDDVFLFMDDDVNPAVATTTTTTTTADANTAPTTTTNTATTTTMPISQNIRIKPEPTDTSTTSTTSTTFQKDFSIDKEIKDEKIKIKRENEQNNKRIAGENQKEAYKAIVASIRALNTEYPRKNLERLVDNEHSILKRIKAIKRMPYYEVSESREYFDKALGILKKSLEHAIKLNLADQITKTIPTVNIGFPVSTQFFVGDEIYFFRHLCTLGYYAPILRAPGRIDLRRTQSSQTIVGLHQTLTNVSVNTVINYGGLQYGTEDDLGVEEMPYGVFAMQNFNQGTPITFLEHYDSKKLGDLDTPLAFETNGTAATTGKRYANYYKLHVPFAFNGKITYAVSKQFAEGFQTVAEETILGKGALGFARFATLDDVGKMADMINSVCAVAYTADAAGKKTGIKFYVLMATKPINIGDEIIFVADSSYINSSALARKNRVSESGDEEPVSTTTTATTATDNKKKKKTSETQPINSATTTTTTSTTSTKPAAEPSVVKTTQKSGNTFDKGGNMADMLESRQTPTPKPKKSPTATTTTAAAITTTTTTTDTATTPDKKRDKVESTKKVSPENKFSKPSKLRYGYDDNDDDNCGQHDNLHLYLNSKDSSAKGDNNIY
jgi:hypothetical protein